MARQSVQITDKPKAATPATTPATTPAPGTSESSRQIAGPGEMVTIQPATIQTSGVSTQTGQAKYTVPTDIQQNVVKLSTGEKVNRSDFGALTESQQAYLMRYGIEAFNAEAQKSVKAAQAAQAEVQQYVETETAKEAAWEASNLVKVGPGNDTILKASFDELTLDQQAQLKQLGIEGYNAKMAQLAQEQEAQVGASQAAAQAIVQNIASAKGIDPTDTKALLQAGVDANTLARAGVSTVEINAVVNELNQEATATKAAPTASAGSVSVLPQGFIGPSAPGEVRSEDISAQLIAKGTIPAGSVVTNYDAATGKVTYRTAEQQKAIDDAQNAVATVKSYAINSGETDPNKLQFTNDSVIKYLMDHPNDTKTLTAVGFNADDTKDEKGNTIMGVTSANRVAQNAAETLAFLSTVVPTRQWDKVDGVGLGNAIHAAGIKFVEGNDWSTWQAMTDDQKKQVALIYATDPNNKNAFASSVEALQQVSHDYPYTLGLITSPLAIIGSPIAKATTGQETSAEEWALAGATAIVTAASLGAAPELGGVAGAVLKGVVTGAAAGITGVMTYGTVKNWGNLTTPEKVASVVMDVAALGGTVLGGVATGRAIKQVVDVNATARAALASGRAYNTMIKVIDAANKEAETKSLVSTETAQRVSESIYGKPSAAPIVKGSTAPIPKVQALGALDADRVFLDKLSHLDNVSYKTLTKFEKLSGYEGLTQAVKDVNVARADVTKAWNNVERQTSTVDSVKALQQVQDARTKLFSALDKLDEITSPRYKPTASPVWDNVIAEAQNAVKNYAEDLAKVRDAISKQQKSVDGLQASITSAKAKGFDTTELEDTLKSMKDVQEENYKRFTQLSGDLKDTQEGILYYQKQQAAGEFIVPEPTVPLSKQATMKELKDFNTELQDFTNGTGRYSSKFRAKQAEADAVNGRMELDYYKKNGFWPSASGPRYPHTPEEIVPSSATPRASIATKEAVNVVPEVMETQSAMELLAKVEEPEAKIVPSSETPKAVLSEVAKTAVAIKLPIPAIIVTLQGRASVSYNADFIASLTPLQFENMFGDEVVIQPASSQVTGSLVGSVSGAHAVTPAAAMLAGITAPQIQGTRVVSPDQAIKIAAATQISNTAHEIINNAQQIANRVAIVSPDPAAVHSTMIEAINAQVNNITDVNLRNAVANEISTITGPGPSIQPQGIPSIQPVVGAAPTTVIGVAPGIETEAIVATTPAVVTGTKIETGTETDIVVGVKPVTETETETQTETEARTETLVKTRTPTEVKPSEPPRETPPRTITPRPIIPVPLLSASTVSKRRMGKVYPNGTIVWKQGYMWKVIPPPYNIKKPITVKRSPAGVVVLEGTPEETLTFIGGIIPFDDVSFNLGVTDGYIDVKNHKIIFTGGGLKTQAGTSIPESKTMGIAFPAVTSERARALEAAQRQALRLSTTVKKRPTKIDVGSSKSSLIGRVITG